MTNSPLASLSDFALLAETVRIAAVERQATSQLLALLAELDTRKLYLVQGYPSLFVYCTEVLRLSESAAYTRITAARAARDFPTILTRLADGAVTLTTVSLLAAHLTDENHDALLDAATHKSKREVERLVACLDPQPDVVSSLRRLPVSNQVESARPAEDAEALVPVETRSDAMVQPLTTAAQARRSVVAPLSAERYLLKVTLSEEAHAKLERIRDLLRHVVPNGDPAAIVDRALTVLLDQLEKTKHGAILRPQTAPRPTATSRRVPAAVKRAVWKRDDGRCAFVGEAGRCPETGFLEFHHVVPFARGGPPSIENLELRCRAHNAHEAERDFGTRSIRARACVPDNKLCPDRVRWSLDAADGWPPRLNGVSCEARSQRKSP